MKEKFMKLLPFAERKRVRQFYKFSVVGFSNTILDFGIYFALTRLIEFFATYLVWANIISFSIAVSNSYFWNRKWTFRSTEQDRVKQYSKFFLVNIVGLIINTSLLSLFVYSFHWHDILSKILAVSVSTFWNFFINRWWVFKDPELAKTPEKL